MKTIKVFLAAAFAIVIMAGCEDEGTEQTPEEIITGTWKVTAWTETDSAGTVTDVYPLDDCLNNGKIIFQDGGILIYDEGPTKCVPSAPQQVTGAWSLNSDATVLTTILDNYTIHNTLLELTETRIITTYEKIGGRLVTSTLEPY